MEAIHRKVTVFQISIHLQQLPNSAKMQRQKIADSYSPANKCSKALRTPRDAKTHWHCLLWNKTVDALPQTLKLSAGESREKNVWRENRNGRPLLTVAHWLNKWAELFYACEQSEARASNAKLVNNIMNCSNCELENHQQKLSGSREAVALVLTASVRLGVLSYLWEKQTTRCDLTPVHEASFSTTKKQIAITVLFFSIVKPFFHKFSKNYSIFRTWFEFDHWSPVFRDISMFLGGPTLSIWFFLICRFVCR